MSAIQEAMQAPPQMAAALDAGIATLSGNQSITFQQYTKVTLEQDGTVFWVAASTVCNFHGSLHYITDRHQDEDQTVAANRFIFTAEQEITQLNSVSPSSMWIGTWTTDGGSLQIAFADRGSFYQQSDLWHYSGYAVYPAMASQVQGNEANLPEGPVVTNSLPIWLAQNSYQGITVPVYSSFLVPDNIQPPYIVAHIEPDSTEVLGAFPIQNGPGTVIPDSGSAPLYEYTTTQLCAEDVRLTLYGFTNSQARAYLQALIDNSWNDVYGFCTSPVIKDDKRTQAEIAALAMKKRIEFRASYNQSSADAIVRRFIVSASVTTTTQE
ncbi:hypothetical protein [Dyella caseinilytica]|uniref:Uncharacterized protein n=1 Tax=Dyella caseinilytica TaxID=1849581 RepID=A0ABX7GXN8_9GAMM|nr:hypothetical protein [Dyella caseinilytica]QRN55253.1 hypothetical protein ISN74_07960 [Dyella caseinilytica]GGA00453.1 hypothetical protein GCM10011408_21710 [Dyella caseinilytica]